MMLTTLVLLSNLPIAAAAFAPAANKPSSPVCLQVRTLEGMPGATMPIIKGWDPLNLSNLGSDSTFAWFRAAELKHSRVAMLATLGYLVQAAGIHFDGMLSTTENISFESLSCLKPLDAWTAVPVLGQAQIIGTILFTEVVTEAQGTHYTKGGDLPTIIFPPINFASKDDPKQNKLMQNRELNNGRLAMIAIMSFIAAANIPGSVPVLTRNPWF